ncbi:AAA family ATPase [Flavipsychrobacter stenotrophus]|uniref:Replication-associated recombination protein A n=1 Tax=Flavipsychrobacter stenotrophus TaxID=2077091 RepID=A0A2S7T1X2_9BACT|nr:replication-associated recombination protein A [Flavipsychrobacter stenotrophus]PQJ12954.1 AAA family ATPase [Flavipsychrobacter stenotrophus]
MSATNAPLAERVRPQTLNDFIGQDHLVGKGKVLEQIVHGGKGHSIIFWGPPGVGKTTLAQIIAHSLNMPFFTLSAIDSGVKDVRAVIELARKAGHALLFIDEIHRFNKAQQDSLLGAVEKGIITLIGATTENPSFEVIGALLSRCQVYVLKALNEDNMMELVNQAMVKDKWLADQHIRIDEWEALIQLSGGDARRLLNLTELIAASLPDGARVFTNARVQDIVQKKMALYDKSGEQHYDIISAFIKSLRGSDPNAAVYYLARMIEGGEDPKFIARRMIILASEDIGNANPNALLLATSCFQAVEMIGYPECRIILSQCATYLASSAKSNASYMAINKAQQLVSQTGDLSVPLHIRNAPTGLMKKLDYGKGYEYAHDHPGNFVQQEFLPAEIAGVKLYDPADNAAEARMRDYLRNCWKEKYGY